MIQQDSEHTEYLEKGSGFSSVQIRVCSHQVTVLFLIPIQTRTHRPKLEAPNPETGLKQNPHRKCAHICIPRNRMMQNAKAMMGRYTSNPLAELRSSGSIRGSNISSRTRPVSMLLACSVMFWGTNPGMCSAPVHTTNPPIPHPPVDI